MKTKLELNKLSRKAPTFRNEIRKFHITHGSKKELQKNHEFFYVKDNKNTA